MRPVPEAARPTSGVTAPWFAVGAALIAVMVLGVALLPGGSSSRHDDLTSFPMGVTPARVGGAQVFVVRTAGVVNVFLTDVHHLAGERSLWWCPKEQVFASPTHGELFDVEGRAVAGPATADLDRMSTKSVGGHVVADPAHVIPGAPQHVARQAYVVLDQKAQAGGWDTGPTSFCAAAVGRDDRLA